MSKIVLYDYWRSSASYRVRIALHLKNLPFTSVSIDLVNGKQRSKSHLQRHPQGLVPAIEIDGEIFTQSLAIIDFLDSITKEPPMLPQDSREKARVQALSYTLAMEVHPICNHTLLNHIASLTEDGEAVKKGWANKSISSGLSAFEARLNDQATGDFCHGNTPSMADCCLIPQLYNAQRWDVSYHQHKNICRIESNCQKLPAFSAAHLDKYKPKS